MEEIPSRHRLADFFYDYWTDIPLLIFGLTLPISTYLFSDEAIRFFTGNPQIGNTDPVYLRFKFWSFIGILIGVIGGVTFGFLHFRKQKRITELEKRISSVEIERDKRLLELQAELDIANEKINENEDKYLAKIKESEDSYTRLVNAVSYDLHAIIQSFCVSMARELEFGTKAKIHERITFYVNDAAAGCFTLLTRYSANTDLNSAGHPSYQKNIGVLGKIWENGYWFSNDYPEFNTAKNKRKYYQRSLRDGMSRKKTESLRMKAQLYAGWRINDFKGNSLAVVMVEANSQTRWQESFLRTYFENESRKLSLLFDAIQSRIPEISSARRRGF